ncbi:hypothetical protein [Legionella bononiensis]|uniref:Coiled-coil protein n=2 Tax=Legionella bononiensis TaxID=2793102 RepID=A0ABS1WDU8_9GAMM|nr:hypothetical protein [Legionella bononiensis]MBL7527536.1 hypothetical protein [Legionella bononiensis]
MMSFIKSVFCFFLCLLFCIPVHAENTATKPTARITLASPDLLYIIEKANKAVIHIDQQMKSLLNLAAVVLAMGTYDPHINARFQAKKFSLVNYLKPLKLHVLGYKDVTIDLYDNSDQAHLHFYLPNLTDTAEMLLSSDISNPERAFETLGYLTDLLKEIKERLPSNITSESLHRFLVDGARNADTNDAQIQLLRLEDRDALLQSLVELEKELSRQLTKLIEITKLATQPDRSKEEREQLDQAYSDNAEIFWQMRTTGFALKTEIPIFHDTQLTMKDKTYFFPQIDLSTLKLESDDLLSIETTIMAFEHSVTAYYWALSWMINNKARLDEIQTSRDDLLAALSSFKGTAEQKKNLLKKISMIN